MQTNTTPSVSQSNSPPTPTTPLSVRPSFTYLDTDNSSTIDRNRPHISEIENTSGVPLTANIKARSTECKDLVEDMDNIITEAKKLKAFIKHRTSAAPFLFVTRMETNMLMLQMSDMASKLHQTGKVLEARVVKAAAHDELYEHNFPYGTIKRRKIEFVPIGNEPKPKNGIFVMGDGTEIEGPLTKEQIYGPSV